MIIKCTLSPLCIGIGYALVNKSESLQVTDTTMFKLQNLDILPTTKIPPTKDAEGNLHVVLKVCLYVYRLTDCVDVDGVHV